ncbi:MAG: AAA family ATPase [Bacteroidales bacterium]|nr:AAA family ATPase [Bacteroidales bacterium]
MGAYINIGNAGFQRVRNSEYVDKSGLIAIVNNTLFTERSLSCVSRSRRFGKSVAAKMLCAYYDLSCDSRHLFADLEIANDPSFEKHLNKYPVIYLDLTDFVSKKDSNIVKNIEFALLTDISEAYPDIATREKDGLMDYLLRVSEAKGQQFFFIIDEWDAICREYAPGTEAMDQYVNLLRRLFKSEKATRVFAGVYMTGILPIKKYKTESALNNFIEYSMVEPVDMAPYFGFTRDEVKALAERHHMDFDELEKWYDGYQIGDEQSIFNPNSVMQALRSRRCRSFWAATGAYDAVAHYIQMNYEGLKDDILRMLAGERCPVDPTGFQNDMSVIHTKDDVLTVLIHLGYLSYDWKESECYIPNREVAGEMVNAVKMCNWSHVADALEKSKQLLQATLRGDEEAVAHGVDVAHDENTSILSYNDENSLACVLSIAYYYASNDYIIHRELATGKGFADLVLIPRKNVDSPAIIIELKYDKAVDTAIDQIKRRQYPAKVAQYADNLLLVGITYHRDTKQHECRIERRE